MSTTVHGTARWYTFRRVAGAALVVLLAAGWWMFLRPSSLDGPLTLVTVTGVSMEPSFHTGDLAVMRDVDSYAAGDVIAYRAETTPGQTGAYIIHRVVGGNAAGGYVTRGDNNGWDDPWRPAAEQVAGKLWFAVPGAGTAVRWLAQPVHLAALLAALASGLTMLGSPERTEARKTVPLRRRRVASA